MTEQSGGVDPGTTVPPIDSDPARHGSHEEARLDRLERRVAELAQSVESGLVAQARRVESVVGTTRRELVEAMGDHSDLVEAITRAVREALADPAVADASARDPEAAPVVDGAGVVQDLRDELQQDRLTLREGLRREVEDLRSRLSEDVHGVRDQVRTLVEQALDRPDASSSDDGVADRVRALLDEVTGGMSAAERRLGETLDSLREVQESLVAHLVERDRQVAIERAQLTRAFVEELAGALSKRDRRRIARRLSVDRVATSDAGDPAEDAPRAAGPTSTAGAPATPATPPTPANVPVTRPVADAPAADAPADDAPAAEAAVSDTPAAGLPDDAPAGTPDPHDRPRVQPSLGTRPVHDRASTPRDPAAMRRTLAAVRGLGPARQAALVSAFASLDELRDATDDELLSVRGIGPSLLEPIRSVL